MARKRKQSKAEKPASTAVGCLVLLLFVSVPLMIAVPPLGFPFFIFGFFIYLLVLIGLAIPKKEKTNTESRILTEQEVEDAAQKICNAHGLLPRPAGSRPPDGKLPLGMKFSGKNLERVLDAVERKVTAMQKNFERKVADIETSKEMIEITWISGRKKIYMVGKEGNQCYCCRLKSNHDIIKVRKYSTEYPFDLIDTKGARNCTDTFFEQVSLDKKTNTEKTKKKKLISWRLFQEGELEMVYDQKLGWRVIEKEADTNETLVSNIFFYFDHHELKRGPFSLHQFQELAERGIIKPNTPVKTQEGQEGRAEQIPGLIFAPPPKPFTVVVAHETISLSDFGKK